MIYKKEGKVNFRQTEGFSGMRNHRFFLLIQMYAADCSDVRAINPCQRTGIGAKTN